jgi:ATP synthase protein I
MPRKHPFQDPSQDPAQNPDNRRISVAGAGSDAAASNGGYNAGMAIFSYVIGGILVWSLIGWGLDILLGTRWFVLVGAFVGMAGGFYLSFARRLSRPSVNGAEDTRQAKAEGSSE